MNRVPRGKLNQVASDIISKSTQATDALFIIVRRTPCHKAVSYFMRSGGDLRQIKPVSASVFRNHVDGLVKAAGYEPTTQLVNEVSRGLREVLELTWPELIWAALDKIALVRGLSRGLLSGSLHTARERQNG